MLRNEGELGPGARYAVTDRWGGAGAAPYDELNLATHVGDDPAAVTENRARVESKGAPREGPSLLEVRTYRFAGHSRADQAAYRPAGELEAWRLRDPLTLRRCALIDGGRVTADQLDEIEQSVRDAIADVVQRTSATPEPDAGAMFRNVWTPAAASPAGQP